LPGFINGDGVEDGSRKCHNDRSIVELGTQLGSVATDDSQRPYCRDLKPHSPQTSKGLYWIVAVRLIVMWAGSSAKWVCTLL